MKKELFNTKLSRKIENDENFSKLFELLNNLAIKIDLKFEYNKENISFINVKDLIQYGFIFASSELDKHKQIALRISYISYVLINELGYGKNIIDYKDILQLLLSRLGNNVSLPLILGQKKNNINHDETLFGHLETSNIPIDEKVSVLKNISENLFKINEKYEGIILNDSQTELIQIFNENKYISFSGPTSFGKTFLLINYILKDILIEKEDSTYIFVLPTISLLSEIKGKFQKELIELNIFNDTLLSSNPKISENDDEINYKNKIFIFTQERLSSFLVNQEDIKINILVIDEAYNIEDLNRGIILLDGIKTVINKSNDTKIIFSSPLLDNPEKFFEIFNLEKSKQHKKVSISPVLQNKIGVYCNSIGEVKFYLHEKNEKSESTMKELILEKEFNIIKKNNIKTKGLYSYYFILEILNKIELKGTTFVFIEAPKDMISFSNYIIKQLPKINNKEINETSEFLKDFLHKDFSLAETIKYGVIYYFGDLPNIVKDKLSFLIDKGLIKYIISNQSLIQGVNFPIKNIIIKSKNNLDGISNKINELDFKNLIGRAGRLLEDFTGNIFYFYFSKTIEIKNELDFYEKKTFFVKSSIENLFSNDLKLFNFNNIFRRKKIINILDKNENNLLFDNSEHFEKNNGKTLNYFIRLAKNNKIEPEKEKLKEIVSDSSKFEFLMKGINESSEKIELPLKLLEKNKFINFEYQNEFYKKLKSEGNNYILKFNLEKPNSSNFIEFQKDFRIVIFNLEKYFKVYGNPKYVNLIVSKTVSYIYEYSISEIILNNIKFLKDKNKPYTVDEIIKSNLDIIRTGILFKLSSHISCLYDIINFYLEEQGKEKIIDYELATYIDNGCFKPQTFEFINLGFSRYSAIYLSGICKTKKDNYLEWIKNNIKYIDNKNVLWEINSLLKIVK